MSVRHIIFRYLQKYSMATLALAWGCMTELWMSDVIPEARIFQDCDKFERALDAIIEAKGIIVETFMNSEIVTDSQSTEDISLFHAPPHIVSF